MTISSDVRKDGPYTGNSITTDFPFTFKVFGASDLLVVLADDLGSESTLVLSSDYTVTLNADQNSNPGGTVSLISAPATNWRLTITSAVPNEQPTDITNMGGFYPQVIEDALDRHTIQIQQVAEQASRAFKVKITDTIDPDQLVQDLADDAASARNAASLAEGHRDDALAHSQKAQQWAENPEDVEVETGAYSAFHWAEKTDALAAPVIANATNINAVAANATNINTVAGISANVTTVAGISGNVTTVAGISTAVTNVAADQADIGVVSLNISSVNTVAGVSADVSSVAGLNTEIAALGARTVQIDALYAELPNIATKVSKTSDTGSAVLPSGTEAQRDGTPAAGYIRFNQTAGEFEGFNGTSWASIGGSEDYLTAASNLSDLANAATARNNLGLGSAATATVTTSASDDTTGRLLKVGDFGLGSTDAPNIIGTDLNQATQGGFYNVPVGVTNTPPSRSAGTVLVVSNSVSSGRCVQYYCPTTNSNELWVRKQLAGVWASWTQVYHQESILGTVSQSGGVPTGAIIETGTNANGRYVKFANGTLLCESFLLNADVGNASGSVFLSSNPQTWTFPAAFSGGVINVSVYADNLYRWAAAEFPASGTNVVLRQYCGIQSTSSQPMRAFAVGIW